MPSSEVPHLAAHQLTRSFGAHLALSDISFSATTGELLVVTGPNGAGKSTLLRVLAGLLRPARGRVELRGRTMDGHAGELRRQIGFAGHDSLFYDDLTLRDNLTLAARLQHLPDPGSAATAALDRARLTDRADESPRALSRGMRQRAALARALMHSPSVLLLDEPFAGLDADSATALRQAITDGHRARVTVVVTHEQAGFELLPTRLLQLDRGRLVSEAHAA